MAIIVEEYDIFKGYEVNNVIEFERIPSPTVSSYNMRQSFIGTLGKVNDEWVVNTVGYIHEWYPKKGTDTPKNNDYTIKLRQFIKTQEQLPGSAVKIILGIVSAKDKKRYDSSSTVGYDTPSGD